MNNTATKTNSKFTIQQIAMIAVMTAVTCVLAPLSVPIGPVPISLTNLVIYFSLFILGTKKGTISYLIYLLIGLVGIPVFSGFTSGPGKLFGPTGGYLIGFIPLALIAGYFINHFHNKKALSFLGMILGTAVCYALGTTWLAIQAHMGFQASLMAGVVPFLPGDFIKMILALLIAPQIRKQLDAAGLAR